MTVAATPLLTGLPATLPARLGAGHGWERCLVVLLRFFGDDGKEKRLLPSGWLPRSIKPSVGRLARTTQRRNDDGSGIRGERISEGHGQILPQKKKYAMQKINLAKCPQCRQSTHMSNTATKSPLIKKLEAAQAARKVAFFQSDSTPWSREEWRWHNERQQELVKLRASFSGSDLEFLAQI